MGIQVKFLQRLQDMVDSKFNLSDYFCYSREQNTIADSLTKPALCTVSNLKLFLGEYCQADNNFNLDSPFWGGPSIETIQQIMDSMGNDGKLGYA